MELKCLIVKVILLVAELFKHTRAIEKGMAIDIIIHSGHRLCCLGDDSAYI